MKQKELEKKQMKAVKRHLQNIKRLEKGNPTQKELGDMYGYLDSCWICEKKFTIWDRLLFNMQHSFEGNCHKRCWRD
jgi:hypothetical protein